MGFSNLDYMTRGIEWEKRQKLINMMDPHGTTMRFNFLICKFLKDPYTTSRFTLLAIPNSHDPEKVEAVRQEYREYFASINKACIDNGIYPFFDDPNDLAACERHRESLIREWPEWIQNKHFKVNSYYDYLPPKYDPNVPNPYNNHSSNED